MNAKTAVKRTREMWAWLAETGIQPKYLYWDNINYHGRYPMHDCWLCEYTSPGSDNGEQECSRCPLVDLWTVRDIMDDPPCSAEGAEYNQWNVSDTTEERKKCAAQIVALCDKWLEMNREI